MKIRAIVTGVTGMVGEGVLHECLLHPDVEQVLVVSRKPCGVSHPKLKELLHGNFYDISAIESQLKGYNACYYCLGVTVLGKKEEEYNKVTYEMTLNFARTVSKLNPDMTYCYVSGAGTNANSKNMWARIKGKTENDLLKLPFKQVFMFRPGYMQPTPGLKNVQKLYNYVKWMYPFLRPLFPKFMCTLKDLGVAMINTVNKGYPVAVLEVKDIVALATK